MKERLLEFINSHKFAYHIDGIDYSTVHLVANELDNKNIMISNETLELISLSTNIIKQFLYYIDLLYLSDNKEVTYMSEKGFFQLIFVMYYGYNETMGYINDDSNSSIDPYLKNIFYSFKELGITYVLDSRRGFLLSLIYNYYWYNRYNISYQELLDVLKPFYSSEGEVLKLAGIIDDKYNILVDYNKINDFIEGLFKRKKVIL